MKKKCLFISFIFAFLMCFSLNFFNVKNTAYAEESSTITITFNPLGGSCSSTSVTLQSGESLSELPIAEKRGYYFNGWLLDSELVTTSTTFNQSETLYASYLTKNNNYTITQTATTFKIVGFADTNTFEYTLADNCDSLENAISLILSDIASPGSETNINFESITLTQDLNLPFQKVSITGTINLGDNSLIYTPPVDLSVLNLKNLTLNSTGSQDLVKIAGAYSSTVSVSNVNFNSSTATDNYSIMLESPVHSLIFDNSLSYSTKYLYNYDLHSKTNAVFQRRANFNETFTLSSPSKIAITIPYYVHGQYILSTFSNSTLFEVFANQTNFTCSVKPDSSFGQKNIYVNTTFDILFDENGATVEEEFANNSTSFKPNQNLMFPSEDNYKKEHFYLDGFVGKLTLGDDSVWYFDATALENFKTNNYDFSKISDYFYSSIPNTNLLGFTYYKYDSTGSDLNYLATKLMLDQDQTPEFIAVWKDILYSISFEENGGNETSNASGIYNSNVILPSLTRVGYDFVGWFENQEDAETADPTKVSSISSMPDTNPTLYAGWKIHSHTLYIHKNNHSSTIEKTVEFGTMLNTIPEIDSTLLSKTGYAFAGWFTDSEFLTPLEENRTMPDSNLSIYAKWTLQQYTISLYLNHKNDRSLYKSTTRDYNIDITDFFTETPSFEGYSFNCWCSDENGRYPYLTFPETMPAENITLYASWSQLEYRLNIYHPAMNFSDYEILHFGDELPLLVPSYSGLIFDGWYLDESFTSPVSITTMPSRNLAIYAKFLEKQSIALELTPQTYSISENSGFVFSSDIENFIVEYLINDEWTTNKPTEKGSYDVKISRVEDSVYNSYSETIKAGLVITADIVDIGIYSLVLYCIAGLELIIAIILLFLNKQRKSYLTYAITLPFGLVQTSQFINLIVSLTLTVFGFVLIIVQIVKLRKINNEIAKISIENKEYTPPDVSENSSVSKKVEILLQKEGFVSEKDIDNDDDLDKIDFDAETEEKSDEDDYLSFSSKKKDSED